VASKPRARPRPARYFVPRSHRLFMVFDDRATAGLAVAALQPPASDDQEPWFFEGRPGADEFDPDAVVGAGRAFSWLFSHNIEHLRELSRIVADGQVVVAVYAKDLRAADKAARLMRERGGQWATYTAHGNFVPLSN
jgi:hypothetical protein